jgi:hypothetical protein
MTAYAAFQQRTIASNRSARLNSGGSFETSLEVPMKKTSDSWSA